MRKLIVLSIAILIVANSYCQTDRYQTDWFLYWQPSISLEFSDFQKIPNSDELSMFNKYGVQSMANVQIHAILDYPKKARKINTLKEQWYIAPAFCKKCSPISEHDKSELLQAQVYFDIAEFCARISRRSIAEIEQQLNDQNVGNGAIAAAFPRIVDEMYNLMAEMFSSYGRQVIIDKNPGAYEEWRSSVDEMLESTIEYQTKSIECKRFMNEKPFSDEYQVSYEVYGKEVR